MKISNDEFVRALTAQREHTPETTSPQSHEGFASSKEFSDTTKIVKRIKRELDKLPDVREESVEELKAKIETGIYEVSSEEIVDLMIRRAQADRIL